MKNLICVRRYIVALDEVVVQWLDTADPVQYRDWVKFIGTTDKSIERTTLDEVVISTIFAGCDLHYGKGAERCPFETRIFNLAGDIEPAPRLSPDIYAAKEAHVKAVTWVKQQLGYPTEELVGNPRARWNF